MKPDLQTWLYFAEALTIVVAILMLGVAIQEWWLYRKDRND